MPSQFAGKVILKSSTPGGGTIDMRLYKQAGIFLNYQVLLIGGAGGRSAQALAYGGISGPYAGRAGGGGGGTLLLQGVVTDLPDTVGYYVGGVGTQPANAGNNAKAPNGGNGGDSTFYDETFYAEGGRGGVGGDGTGNSSNGSVGGAVGGAGGGNSAGLGSGGVGGNSGTFYWSTSGSPDGSGQTLPTAGTYVGAGGPISHPRPTVIGGGHGGGGGRPDIPDYSPFSPSAGANGNNGGFAVPPSGASGADGGYGGGGSYGPIDYLVTEYYGSGAPAAGRFAQGLVAINLF
jgi:hypothetical protein